MAGDSGAHRIDVAVDLRVIGRFITGEVTVRKESDNQQNDECNHDCNAKTRTLSARRVRAKVPFGGRQRFVGGLRFPGYRWVRCGGRSLRRLLHTLIRCLSDIA